MASLILQQSRLSWREVTDKVNAKYGRNKTPQSAKSHYLRAFPVPDIESMQTWTPRKPRLTTPSDNGALTRNVPQRMRETSCN